MMGEQSMVVAGMKGLTIITEYELGASYLRGVQLTSVWMDTVWFVPVD